MDEEEAMSISGVSSEEVEETALSSESEVNTDEEEDQPTKVLKDDELGEIIVESSKYYEERAYQTELIELAKKRDLIVCLPTGSGKTFIALQLAKFYLPECLKDGKYVIFAANTVPLVYQQAKYFAGHIPNDLYKVKTLTGDDGVDNWNETKWGQNLQGTLVLVMIDQILFHALENGFLKFESFRLLILDECHHADKDHPMSQIMKLRKEQIGEKRIEMPRFLGLTATIIKGKPKENNIVKHIAEIEDKLDAKVVTFHNYEEVLKNSTKAHENIIYKVYSKPPSSTDPESDPLKPLNEAKEFLEENKKYFVISNETPIEHHEFKNPDQLKERGKAKNWTTNAIRHLYEVKRLYEDLGPYPARFGAITKRFFILSSLNLVDGDEELILSYVSTALSKFISRIDDLIGDNDQILDFVSDKVKKLLEIFDDFRGSEAERLSGIIFVETRIGAQVLNWFLKDVIKYCRVYNFIKPAFVTGTSHYFRDPEELRVTNKRQAETIQGFRDGEYNLIISTSVLEEGIDVPSCNIVIRFDSVKDFPSFVQSMGRARDDNARFIVLDEMTGKNKALILNYLKYQQNLIKYLVKHAKHLLNEGFPEPGNEDEEDSVEDVEILRKYISRTCIPGTDLPRIGLQSAIATVYRYCGMLKTTDPYSFKYPIPFYVQREEDEFFKVNVFMPPHSIIKDVVEGEYMRSKSHAKRVAFLKICGLLYENNVLDDHMMPKRPELPVCVNEFFQKKGVKHSSVKGGRWIPKKIPNVFIERPMKPGVTFTAYKICIDLTSSNLEEDIGKLYQFEKKSHFFCILSQFPIHIPKFELKSSFGKLSVRLETITIFEKDERIKPNILSQNEIDSLLAGQDFIFSTILGEMELQKLSLAITKTPHYLIAPIVRGKGGYEIYWNILEDAKGYKDMLLRKPSDDERRGMSFNKDAYTDGLVLTWYKAKTEANLVLSINEERNSTSKMGRKISFADHYAKSYKIEILHPEFPLVKCKEIRHQLNFLKNEPSKRAKKDQPKPEYPPELVYLTPFPGTLYIQSYFLPSILQRMSQYILSKEIRDSVANSCNWNSAMEPEDFESEVIAHTRPNSPDIPKKKQKLEIEHKIQDLALIDDEPGPSKKINQNGGEGDVLEAITPDSNEEDEDFHYEFTHPSQLNINHLEIMRNRKKRISLLKAKEQSLPVIQDGEIGVVIDLSKEQIWEKYGLPNPNDIKLDQIDSRPDFSIVRGPGISRILQATTLKGSNEKVDMERLETLGDSFLKYITSLNLFVTYPELEQDMLTIIRSKLVGNAHLHKLGMDRSLGGIISYGVFNPKESWLPPCFDIPPRNGDLDRFSASKLDDKRVADAGEALIGAYYLHGGPRSALRFMDWLGIKIPASNSNETPQSLFYESDYTFLEPPQKSPKDFLPFHEELEALIGYSFKNLWLLVQAFTHPGSNAFMEKTGTPSYERLEYLGDASLDLLILQHIYKHPSCFNPGELSELKSALVNNNTLGSLAMRYGFDKHLRARNRLLSSKIGEMRVHQEFYGHKVSGHYRLIENHGIKGLGPYFQEIEVPKVLGDIFESLAGAILIDSGMSLDTLWRVIYRLMKKEIDEFSSDIPKDPVKAIMEECPGFKKKDLFESLEIGKTSPYAIEPSLYFQKVKVWGESFIGCGSNKKNARVAACEYALQEKKTAKA